jgi:4-amino-4-deoxy-L-arabinose transferase-like glycosyltransferase
MENILVAIIESPIIESPIQEQEHTTLLEGSHQPLLLWHKFALGGVLVISVFFNFYDLTEQYFFEYYFGAAVKSMLMSWHNFFFVSFDPAGFVSVDKPPLGFWIEALSAKFLGFSAFSVVLPETLAGVLSVALLFHLVRRTFGPVAGLIAALVLALTPISVVTNRNDLVDSLLVLTVLLAAWAVSKAAETGRFRWLCLCAVLVGLGFNIKMLQAYLVVPAFGLLYLLGAPVRWRTKIGHLVLALGVLLVVSLSWATIVDLTPANQRPYVGSSPTNSELNLAFGYNGIFRLTAGSNVEDYWAWEIGRPGPLRFFEQPMGGQLSWFLPLALLSIVALSWQTRWRLPLKKQHQAVVLWGIWLLTMVVFFSIARYFHLYYLPMLAPAIGALVGAGVVTLWQDYVRPGWRGWLLPYAVLITAAVQAYLLYIADSLPIPILSVVGPCVITEFLLLMARLRLPLRFPRMTVALTALGFLSLLLAPTVWSVMPLSQGSSFPMAGPEPEAKLSPVHADPVLLHYLFAHKGHAQFLLATQDAPTAAPIILDTGQAVMALGGYNGNDHILTSNQLIQQIDNGTVRFFLLPSFEPDPSVPSWAREGAREGFRLGLAKILPEAMGWVIMHCTEVPTAQWQLSPKARLTDTDTLQQYDKLQLYDCAHHT